MVNKYSEGETYYFLKKFPDKETLSVLSGEVYLVMKKELVLKLEDGDLIILELDSDKGFPKLEDVLFNSFEEANRLAIAFDAIRGDFKERED